MINFLSIVPYIAFVSMIPYIVLISKIQKAFTQNKKVDVSTIKFLTTTGIILSLACIVFTAINFIFEAEELLRQFNDAIIAIITIFNIYSYNLLHKSLSSPNYILKSFKITLCTSIVKIPFYIINILHLHNYYSQFPIFFIFTLNIPYILSTIISVIVILAYRKTAHQLPR